MRDLDRGRFGLGRILEPARTADMPLTNAEFFAMPSMAPVRAAIDAEFDRYATRHKSELPDESIGVGDAFAFQLFDRAQLIAPDTRLVLAGIVNRMDRTFVDPAACGEIRLIYRLVRTNAPANAEASPRLPSAVMAAMRTEKCGSEM